VRHSEGGVGGERKAIATSATHQAGPPSKHQNGRDAVHAIPIVEAVVRPRFLSSRRACSERRRQQTASSLSVTPRRGASPNPASSQSANCDDVDFDLQVDASVGVLAEALQARSCS